jgi:hypothetical protein
MGNLTSSSVKLSDPRPFQTGKLGGSKNGLSLEVANEWLIDTGATVSAITKSKGDQFDLTPTGASASATTGGGGIIMKSGLTATFVVFDSLMKANRDVSSALDVGVKPNDYGSEILGMDQLANVGANVRWDPTAQDGDIYE